MVWCAYINYNVLLTIYRYFEPRARDKSSIWETIDVYVAIAGWHNYDFDCGCFILNINLILHRLTD